MNKNIFLYKLIEGKINGQQNSHNYLTFSKQAAAYNCQMFSLHDLKKFCWDNQYPILKNEQVQLDFYIHAPDLILKIQS